MERKQIDKFVIENGVLLQYDGQSKVVEIPDGVEWIGRWAFAFNKNIETLILPDAVTTIEEHAFVGCSNLQDVKIGSDSRLIRLANGVFSDCVNLNEINLPDSLEIIGNSCFSNTGLKYLHFGVNSRLKTLGNRAFADCKFLVESEISSGVIYYGCCIFRGCESLQSISYMTRAFSVDEKCFDGCRMLKSIVLPEKIKYIHPNAFKDCMHLKDVYFEGTENQWNTVKISRGNKPLKKARIHLGK